MPNKKKLYNLLSRPGISFLQKRHVLFRPRKPREPKAPKPKKQKQEVLSAKQKKKVVSKQFISSSEDNSSSDEDGLKIDVAKT